MPVVRRTDEELILKNHEDRILALERAPVSSVYTDVRVLDAAVDHVLFQGFPSSRTILELSWMAILDIGSTSDPCFAGLLINGDAVNNEIGFDEDEYRWNIGIPNDSLSPPGTYLSADEGAYFNDYGVVSWISTGELSWGRIRFPAYPSAGDLFDGRPWVGDCSVGSEGNGANPGVCAGDKDSDTDPLTALSMIATSIDGSSLGDRQEFAAGSWFALTAY